MDWNTQYYYVSPLLFDLYIQYNPSQNLSKIFVDREKQIQKCMYKRKGTCIAKEF